MRLPGPRLLVLRGAAMELFTTLFSDHWPGRNDQSVRRLLENYHNDPEIIEHRAAKVPI
jgi:hypothetical protein